MYKLVLKGFILDIQPKREDLFELCMQYEGSEIKKVKMRLAV